ncbi:MAG: hypothetical protein WCK15_20070 [Pirellula sp.]
MIQDLFEYDHARTQLAEQSERLKIFEAQMRAESCSEAEIKRAMDPLISFHLGKREEVQAFEQSQHE